MSFGSAMRFDVGAAHGKPAIFWDQGKQPKKPKKFGYKSREMRHPVRDRPKDDLNQEVVVIHHGKLPHQPLAERTEQLEQKQQKPARPAKDFIRKNRERAGGKKKAAVDVDGKTKTDHPMANTVTLTQDQLNAILASVGNMASGKENALRISIDKESNEIQIANAGVDQVKHSPVEGDKEEATEEEGNIFSLLNESKKENIDGRSMKGRHNRDSMAGKQRGVKQRDNDESVSVSTEKNKEKKVKVEKKSKVSEKTGKDDKSVKFDKIDVKTEDKPNSDPVELLFYESPRLAPTHLTVAEKKRLQWARERAELSKNYDPWGRPGAGAPLRDNAGQVLADYNNRKDELQKSVDEETDKSDRKTARTSGAVEKNEQKHRQQDTGGDTSPRSKANVGGFVVDEEKIHITKDDEKKKWLEELDKQREEQRKKKQKSKERDKSGPDDTWADRFATYKPAPLPQQDAGVAAKEKRSSQMESSSSPHIANPQHAAIRSSFVNGENAYKSPKEDVYSIDLKPLQNAAPDEKRFSQTKDEEKRKWLEDLERQIEEKRMRKMKEKDQESETLADTWADRFTYTENTNQSALDRQPEPEPTPQQMESSGRVSSAPQPMSARDDLDTTHLRGQNVVVDPITRQELEVKKRRYLDHQEALRKQIEEKERLKREERNRKMREEMEEEAKLRNERESLQSQFDTEQQKIRQKEEARQRRIDELKLAMDEAQEKAQQEKLIRRMEHLRQGGHDISHLKAHLDAMSPRIHHQVEPTQVPGLNLRQSQESSTGYQFPEISSRTVDLPNPTITTHQPYTENRVVTPSRYRHPSRVPPPDPSSPKREFGTQTLEADLADFNTEIKREVSEVDIEYKETRKAKPAGPVKKVRVKSAEEEVKAELRRERKRERLERLRASEKMKWNYQNPKLQRPKKQSERDPLYSRKRQQSEERRARREKELLHMVEMNKPIIPEDVGGFRSRDPSPGKDRYTPRGQKGRSLSPDRHGIMKRRGDNSLSPNRSIEREQERGRSPVRYRSPSPPVPSLRTTEVSGHSPPVPALKHRREGGKGERAQVLKVNDSDGYDNTYDNDQYSYSNYRPPTGQRKPQGHYQERNPIDAPVDSGDFVPFTRTTEILDPAKAVEPMQLSRENTQVKRGRKVYKESQHPGNYGTRLDNHRDKQDKNDPIMNPDLVKGHPTARQDMILQQLSTLKQSLMQRQRELETCMSPSDYDQ